MTQADALLSEAAPAWAALLARSGDATDWIAAPALPSGARTAATFVRVRSATGALVASERTPGERLPRRCPELHVNGDSSFCLGRWTYPALDRSSVARFWQDLGEYLVGQHHAARRGRWPAGRWLSHGPDAADRQAEAEAIAAEIGIEDEYTACLEGEENWIARAAATGGGFAPGAACPRGCRDADGRAFPLRRCRHRARLQRLVAAERRRRAAEADFFGSLRRAKVRCCDRVEGCPLKRGRRAA